MNVILIVKNIPILKIYFEMRSPWYTHTHIHVNENDQRRARTRRRDHREARRGGLLLLPLPLPLPLPPCHARTNLKLKHQNTVKLVYIYIYISARVCRVVSCRCVVSTGFLSFLHSEGERAWANGRSAEQICWRYGPNDGDAIGVDIAGVHLGAVGGYCVRGCVRGGRCVRAL